MKHINSYINESQKFNLINESELFTNYGKYLDSAIFKLETYTTNHLNNSINESSDNYKLSLNESIAVNNLFRFILEDIYNSLSNECKVYEAILNNETPITEDVKLAQYAKNLYNSGKDKINKAYQELKIKTGITSKKVCRN